MIYLTFHLPPEQGNTYNPVQTLRADKYVNMLNMMRTSAQTFDDNGKAVLMTGMQTAQNQLPEGFELFRQPAQASTLMFDRTAAQYVYLKREGLAQKTVMLDSDILINAPLQEIFQHDFDVALTWRKSANMPINGGFMIFNNDRPKSGQRFMRGFLDVYSKSYKAESNWYGDQLALRDWVGVTHREMARRPLIKTNGCRILFLHCDEFNHSPDNHASQYLHRDPTVKVVHFKGERKRFMLPYWHAHLSTLNHDSAWNRFRSLRAQSALRKMADEPWPAQVNAASPEQA